MTAWASIAALCVGFLVGVVAGLHAAAPAVHVAPVWTDQEEAVEGVVYRRIGGKWRRLDAVGCVMTERDGARGWACAKAIAVSAGR